MPHPCNRLSVGALQPRQRHYLSVPKAVFRALTGLPGPARDQVLERALDSVRGQIRVWVCDANRVLLNPCHPARARELIRRGRGRLISVQPPLLQLQEVVTTPAHAAEEGRA